MQATTAHLPTIVFREARTVVYPFVLAILCILTIALSGMAEHFHQLLDPAYKQQIDAEQAANQALNEKLNKIEQSKLRGR